MRMSDLFQALTPLDAAAIALMGLGWLCIGWLIEHPPPAALRSAS